MLRLSSSTVLVLCRRWVPPCPRRRPACPSRSCPTRILTRTRPRYAQSPCHGRCAPQPQAAGARRGCSSGSIQGYQRAGLITSEELSLIKKVDRQSKAKVEALLGSDGPTYASLYLGLLKKLQRVDTQSCILVLIADALTGMSCEISAKHIVLAYRSYHSTTPPRP